jgi:DNA polymerase-3 subunit gamma/tau
MATLYRKYRPQNFKEIVGQNHIKITLEHEIESVKIAHAYLFCGPRAVGKTTIARVLAKAINCLKRQPGEHEPCNECEMCQQITVGRNMDILEIDAASHTGVDNVRENIIAASRVMPSQAKYKVFIIDEVHMLSISAFNALLKIIEEPPEFVVFILCTTEIHKVPATIISRCQRFDFKRIGVIEITNKLQYITNKEGIVISRNILESIARQSEGHMRDAESLLGQVVSIGGKEVTDEEADLVIPRSNLGEAINLIGYLVKKDAGSAIGLINKLIDEGINLNRFLTDMIELMRKIMLTKLSPSLSEKLGLALGESLEAEINKVSREITLDQSIIIIEKIINAKNEIKGSFIPQLPIEMAIAELSAASAPKTFFSSKPASVISPSANQNKPPVQNINENTPNIASQGAVNQDLILAKWFEVLAKIKKYNHSLSLILRVCQPVEINGNQLCLAFKYKFHKDRISEEPIKRLVEKILHEVYGSPLIIEAVINENLEVTATNMPEASNAQPEGNNSGEIKNEEGENIKKEVNLIDNLLKTFGGKIVS